MEDCMFWEEAKRTVNNLPVNIGALLYVMARPWKLNGEKRFLFHGVAHTGDCLLSIFFVDRTGMFQTSS